MKAVKCLLSLAVILAIQTVVFVQLHKTTLTSREYDDIANALYLMYQDEPEDFIRCSAEITEYFDFGFSLDGERSYCKVKFSLEDGSKVFSYVLEDVGTNKIGDEIEIAYFKEYASKDDYILATQVYYIENKPLYISYAILEIADCVLAVVFSVILIGKAVRTKNDR